MQNDLKGSYPSAMTSSVAQDPVPPMLGKYRPFLKVGRGGMADIYLALAQSAPGVQRLAIIKRLRSDIHAAQGDLEELQQFSAMFRDEAKLAMLLNHPNIVHTYDVCEDGDALYIVMEYIDGASLDKIWRHLTKNNDRMSAPLAALIVADTLAGLHYAHELKDFSGGSVHIVHRDVSPQNILVGYDGVVKLLDFGIAMASSRFSANTVAGTMKGKARYMAPEQLRGHKIDCRADVYSAGVVLWELLAGRRQVEGNNEVEQMMSVLNNDRPSLESVVPDLDPSLQLIVRTALANDREQRYQTALEMREALERYLLSVGGETRTKDIRNLVSTMFAEHQAAMTALIRSRLSELGEPLSSAPERATEIPGSGVKRRAIPAEVFIKLDEEHHREKRGMPLLLHGESGSIKRNEATETLAPMAPLVESPIGRGPMPESTPTRKKRGILFFGAIAVGIGTGLGLVVALMMPKVPIETAVTTKANEDAVAFTAVVPAPSAPLGNAPVATGTGGELPNEGATPRNVPAPVGTPPLGGPAAPIAHADHGRPARPSYPPAVPPHIVAQPPAPREKETPPPQPQPAAAAPASEPGFVTIDTFPWTKVSMDGRVLGATPLVKTPVSPGTHTLTLDNPGENIHQTATVVVKSGEITTKRLAF